MARKSKTFNELLQQKRYGDNPDRGMQKLQRQLEEGPLKDKIAEVITTPQGQEKMSDVLEAFVEPYLDMTPTYEAQQKLFMIAIMAWNIAIMPEEKHQPEIENIVENVMKLKNRRDKQDTTAILEELIARKQALFADNKRFIVNFNLQKRGNTFDLSVASTLPNQPNSNKGDV